MQPNTKGGGAKRRVRDRERREQPGQNNEKRPKGKTLPATNIPITDDKTVSAVDEKGQDALLRRKPRCVESGGSKQNTLSARR